MDLDQEKELIQRIHADRKEFGILFDHYYGPIFGYVFRRVLNHDLARDISAETFLKAFLNIGSYQWRGISISAWLYKIATREISLYYRKRKYRPEISQNFIDLDHLSAGQLPERETLEEELSRHREFLAVQASLVVLDIKYQNVISLRYFEKKDIREIAQILQKPEGTIKSLLSRGLEKLRIVCNEIHARALNDHGGL